MLLLEFFIEEYLAHKPDTSKKTVLLYRNTFRQFGQWLGEPPRLEHLTDRNVGRYMSDLMQAGRHRPATINKERTHLLSLWRFANLKGFIRLGPTVQPVKVPETIPTALTVPQLKQLRLTFDQLEGETGGIPNSDFLRACFGIQYATAERIGAVLQLRFEDIFQDVITFRAETRKGGKKPIVKQIPGWVAKDIDRIRNPKRDRIFPIEPTNRTKIHLLYQRLFERAGVPRPKWKSSHLLRSTHATLLELNGGDATKSLGHSSRETTIKSYLDPRHKPDDSFRQLPDLELP